MHIKLLSRLFLKTYLAAAMLLGLPSVYAWDGIVSGAIESIDITEGSNYGFRVILKNSPSMCSGGPNWAYLLDTDSNYKIFVAALLLAKAQSSTVLVHSRLVGSYCHIGYIAVK